MPKGVKENLVGSIFERLTVIEWTSSGWKCLCSCGNVKISSTEHLKNGRVKSCGCLKKETQVANGLTKTYEASSYYAMLVRTGSRDYSLSNPTKFGKYLTEDRSVCDRWLEPGARGLLNFIEDMGKRPEGTTLERIDNSKGYFPENCKWATLTEQARNRGKFKNNTSGRTGVGQYRENSDVWTAYISINKKMKKLGDFKTFEEAVAAREQAELEYYGFIKE